MKTFEWLGAAGINEPANALHLDLHPGILHRLVDMMDVHATPLHPSATGVQIIHMLQAGPVLELLVWIEWPELLRHPW